VRKCVQESVWECVRKCVCECVRKFVRECLRECVWDCLWECVRECVWECVRECRATEIRLCVCKDEQIAKICNESKIQQNDFSYFSLCHVEFDTHLKDSRSSLVQKCCHVRQS
jgi:hypothetical protein